MRRYMAFPKDIGSKMNVITELEFELANFETAIQHSWHYTTESPPPKRIGYHNSNLCWNYMQCSLSFFFLRVFYINFNWFLLLKSDGKKVSSGLQDSSKYPSWF